MRVEGVGLRDCRFKTDNGPGVVESEGFVGSWNWPLGNIVKLTEIGGLVGYVAGGGGGLKKEE